MFRRFVRIERAFLARRCAPGLLLLSGLLALSLPSWAQVDLGPVTVGAGLRTSLRPRRAGWRHFHRPVPAQRHPSLRERTGLPRHQVHVQYRLRQRHQQDRRVGRGGAYRSISRVQHLGRAASCRPATARISTARSTRNEWNVYTDGIQDGYPSVFQGRDNGVAYWGTFAKKVKVSAGAFDGGSVDGNPKVIGAARVQIDFWDPEDGYYLNGTYYGDKNLLAIGGATQVQERPHRDHRRFPSRKESAQWRRLYDRKRVLRLQQAGRVQRGLCQEPGRVRACSFLFPKKVGVGKFEILGKYAKADFTHGTTPNYDQKTTEFNFNYVIKQFNARVMSFCENVRFNREKIQFLAGGNRPPDPDVMQSFLNLENEGVNL